MDILLFKTRLSIIACRHIVPLYYSGEVIKIPEIAAVYGFKARSINPAFTALTKAGILSSQVGGRYEDRGFTYAKDPKLISLYDIVNAIEGDASIACCSDILTCRPTQCSECSIYKELQKVIDYRKKILSATTIYDHYMKMK